jgi:hypothetical protein
MAKKKERRTVTQQNDPTKPFPRKPRRPPEYDLPKPAPKEKEKGGK